MHARLWCTRVEILGVRDRATFGCILVQPPTTTTKLFNLGKLTVWNLTGLTMGVVASDRRTPIWWLLSMQADNTSRYSQQTVGQLFSDSKNNTASLKNLQVLRGKTYTIDNACQPRGSCNSKHSWLAMVGNIYHLRMSLWLNRYTLIQGRTGLVNLLIMDSGLLLLYWLVRVYLFWSWLFILVSQARPLPPAAFSAFRINTRREGLGDCLYRFGSVRQDLGAPIKLQNTND